MTAWGYYSLVLVQRAQGRLDAAVLTCEQALDSLVTAGRPAASRRPDVTWAWPRSPTSGTSSTCALRHATEGIALCRQFVYTPPLADGLATLAMIRQATGDPAGALEAMGEAEQAAPGPGRACSTRSPRSGRGCCWPRATWPRPPAGRRTDGLGPDDEPDYPREPGHLVLARVLLAQDRPGQALALLDRLHAAAAAQDRTGSLIEIGALRALALAASGEETAAVDALAGALTLACPQGYVRVFADEGPPMAALLGRLVAAQRAEQAAAQGPARLPGPAPACLRRRARLRRTPGRHRCGAGHRRAADRRELEVLGMLAAGRSNQAIAGQLVVTLDTVKKHVSHVLDKLGAANRTEAVARARELGLIP